MAAAAIAVLLPCATAFADSRSVFRPASPPADWIQSLFFLVLGIIGVIFLVVEGALVYSLFRFRSRETDDTKEEPPQVFGSRPIEVAWTVGPLLVVFVLFLVVYRTVEAIDYEKAPPDSLHVTVVAHQWWWEFDYPDQGVTTANELHVPVGRPVYLDLKSADVDHSFWVPRLAGKTACIPGRTNHTWFEAKEAGDYHGQCAVFCGVQHAHMRILVVAEAPGDFAKWVEARKEPAREDPAAADGKSTLLSLSCTECHTIRGTPADGTFGPDLTHVASRRTIGAGAAPNDREHLTEWITDPGKIKPGCSMPDMHLDAGTVKKVVRYLETLR